MSLNGTAHKSLAFQYNSIRSVFLLIVFVLFCFCHAFNIDTYIYISVSVSRVLLVEMPKQQMVSHVRVRERMFASLVAVPSLLLVVVVKTTFTCMRDVDMFIIAIKEWHCFVSCACVCGDVFT